MMRDNRDYAELVKDARYCCISGDCAFCNRKGLVENWRLCQDDLLKDAADAIEELHAFALAVAKMAVNAEDDEVSAEVLCRKLYKLGIIEKDGVWWWLPEPPKESE